MSAMLLEASSALILHQLLLTCRTPVVVSAVMEHPSCVAYCPDVALIATLLHGEGPRNTVLSLPTVLNNVPSITTGWQQYSTVQCSAACSAALS